MLEKLSGAVSRPALCRADASRACRARSGSKTTLIDLAYKYDLPLVATNDAFFRRSELCTRRMTRCSASPRALMSARTNRRRLTPEHHFKSPAEMRAAVRRSARGRATTPWSIAQRCAFMLEARKPILPPFPTESGRSEAEELRAQAVDGLEARLERMCSAGDGRGRARSGRASPIASASISSSTSSSRWVSRLLPDRRGLHPMGEGARHSGRAGPRLGRRLGGRLGADHHRSRSDALRPAVRALPQSRARVDAGLRHRFLPGPARRGDPLRPATNMATTASRRSSPSASCRRARCCATSAACCRCPTARSTSICKLVPNNPAKPVTLETGDRRRAGAAGDARRGRERSRG